MNTKLYNEVYREFMKQFQDLLHEYHIESWAIVLDGNCINIRTAEIITLERFEAVHTQMHLLLRDIETAHLEVQRKGKPWEEIKLIHDNTSVQWNKIPD